MVVYGIPHPGHTFNLEFRSNFRLKSRILAFILGKSHISEIFPGTLRYHVDGNITITELTEPFNLITWHFFISAFGLKCYSCASVKSMDECEAAQIKVNCSSSLIDPRCATESYEYKIATDIKTHTKGCKSKAFCDSEARKSACKEANGEKCESSCCDGDLCNTSLVPAASVLLMMSCALVVLFWWRRYNDHFRRSASMILCNQVFFPWFL